MRQNPRTGEHVRLMTEFNLIFSRIAARSTECIEVTDPDSDFADYYPLLYQGTRGEEDCELSYES